MPTSCFVCLSVGLSVGWVKFVKIFKKFNAICPFHDFAAAIMFAIFLGQSLPQLSKEKFRFNLSLKH